MKGSRISSITHPLWLGLLGLAVGLSGALATFSLGRSMRPPITLRGAMLNPPSPAVDFRLKGADDRNYSLYDFQRQPVLLAFSCQTCSQNSALLEKLASVQQATKALHTTPQVLIVNLDPQSSAEFDRTINDFNADFIALSGETGEIGDLARSYDIYFSAGEGQAVIELIALIMLIDDQGTWRAIYPLALSAEDIASDIEMVLEE
jgi:cytochrome oxidase Cu insertion factor (SCO1/SenC/PrrC family)